MIQVLHCCRVLTQPRMCFLSKCTVRMETLALTFFILLFRVTITSLFPSIPGSLEMIFAVLLIATFF